jgi:colicin import membrane protein
VRADGIPPAAASGRLRPWLGSILVHGVLIVVLALAAVQWRTPPEPEQLAIEGNVVRYEDLPRSVKAGKAPREAAPQPRPEPAAVVPPPETQPQVQPRPEPPDPPEPAKPDAEVLRRQEAAEATAKAQAAATAQQAAERQAKDAAALAEKQRVAAEEQRRLEDQRKQAELEAQQQQAEQEKVAAAAAKARAAKEADLRRALEDEEAGEALARSGVVDEYRTLLIQTIERNWIRPASARAGLVCTLNVTQAPGGAVMGVQIGDCNGDQAVRESVANAVYRSSPLPAPRDARAFERRLVIVFKPTE